MPKKTSNRSPTKIFFMPVQGGKSANEAEGTCRPQMPRHELETACRRLALMDLEQLTDEGMTNIFMVVPNLPQSAGEANWRLFIASGVPVQIYQALIAAEKTLQSRWNMIDPYQEIRALVV